MKKILVLCLSILTVLSMTVTAFAAYTPINGTADGFKFNKVLSMDKNANTPAATFSFSVAPGAAIPAGTGTLEVKPGVGSPTIADVTFTANEAGTVSDNTKTVTKQAAVNLSGCSFSEPGVYRYIITEAASTVAGVTNDATPTRTLDVYVQTNSSGALEIMGYVLYEGTKTDAPSATAQTATGKSEGYVNTFTTYALEFGKEVKGNFGSLDQYFEFTLTLSGVAPGAEFNVDLSHADANPTATEATKVTVAANPIKITVGEDGTVTQKFYLHDGQYIKVLGLPNGAKYTLTENAHDYTPADGITAADSALQTAHTDAVSNSTGITGNVNTGFTNTKTAVTPTGIANAVLTFMPALILAALAIFGIVFFSRKRKVNNN